MSQAHSANPRLRSLDRHASGTRWPSLNGTPGGIREPAKRAMSSRPLTDRNPRPSDSEIEAPYPARLADRNSKGPWCFLGHAPCRFKRGHRGSPGRGGVRVRDEFLVGLDPVAGGALLAQSRIAVYARVDPFLCGEDNLERINRGIERLEIGRTPEVDNRDLVPPAEVFAAQLDRLAPCECKIPVIEELALRSALPGDTFRVVQEHQRPNERAAGNCEFRVLRGQRRAERLDNGPAFSHYTPAASRGVTEPRP